MNISIDITHLLLRLKTDWECSVHSCFLNFQGGDKVSEVKVMRLTCNAIECDRNIKEHHLMEVLGNTAEMQPINVFDGKTSK